MMMRPYLAQEASCGRYLTSTVYLVAPVLFAGVTGVDCAAAAFAFLFAR
jgi:hypothetical protein